MAKLSRSPNIPSSNLSDTVGAQTQFNTEVQKALQGQITLKENIAMEIVETTVTAPEPTWIYVGDTANGGPSYANGWTSYTPALDVQAPRYTVSEAGWVLFEGIFLVPNPVPPQFSNMFVFPTGYAPNRNLEFDSSRHTPTKTFNIGVTSSGEVRWNTTVGVAAVGDYVPVSLSWAPSSCPADTSPTTYSSAGPLVPTAGVLAPKSPKNSTTTGQSLPVGFPFKLNPRRITKPTALQLLRCQDLSTEASKYVTHATVPDWEYSASEGLVVKYIGGLHPGRQYKLQFLLLQ